MSSNRYLKKLICNIFNVASVLLLITGCKNSQNASNPAVVSNTVSDQEAETNPFEGELIITETLDECEDGEAVIETQDNTREQIRERNYATVEEMFRETDTYWNSSDEYTSAVVSYNELYSDIINSNTNLEIYAPHIASAYIDGDDIPEFLVSYGNNHVCGVCVYRYEEDDGKALYIGEFGSFGCMGYYERTSLIECYYGNCDCFTYYLSEINNSGVNLRDSWLIDGSGLVTEELRYYHGYVVPDIYDGSREAFARNNASEFYLNFDVNDNHQISEEEFTKDIDNWIGYSKEKCIVISYDAMCCIE